jgi:HTH-type transcriptional repressor of NAD biosynthesis genes
VYDVGFVCGKFYPFHLGHQYMIDQALLQCHYLYVFVIEQAAQAPCGELRRDAIDAAYPQFRSPCVDVRLVPDLAHYEDDNEWAHDFALQIDYVTEGDSIDVVFSSEPYGELVAKQFGADFVVVDLDRIAIPVSGTLIRSDPEKHIDWVHPKMQHYYRRQLTQ